MSVDLIIFLVGGFWLLGYPMEPVIHDWLQRRRLDNGLRELHERQQRERDAAWAAFRARGRGED
jgi:hypothetical protein